ncbi:MULTISPECIES: hypothetical protein [Aeromicrobium]|uniref:Lipoprotein n=1 Tax=Aeromicrobium yanjiei TaxID=2662028 RepID=A0A5Q2MF77_9ACTN|nr:MULTISPECIES: hypothetical protein [Aeromicrobium]MRK02792.1 hypothetical protein [Aeromicrobium sp. S22]QGG40393.1 hypothetical protein GEV26_02855 [Aeromicrobium yanjiei]
MSSARRRPLAVASVAVVTALVLGGCGTSFSAQTNQQYQPGVGANARGDIDAMNTLLVANPDGSATLSTALQNNLKKDQTLSSVTVTTLDDQELEVTAPDEQLPLKPGYLTQVGTSDPAGIFIVDKDAPAGLYVKVTLTFSDSSPITVEAPVVDRTSEYADVVQSPSEAATSDEDAASRTEDTTTGDGQ